MKTLHINLVSEQIIPNLIPTFSDSNCSGVVLVFGDDKLKEKGETLKEIYAERHIPVLESITGTSSHNLYQLNKQAAKLLDYLKANHADKRWVLNVTCGTKPMALAMTLAFYQHNEHHAKGENSALIIYTDTQNKTISVLNENVGSQLPYQSVLTLEELLAANGFTVTASTGSENDNDLQQRADLTTYLGQQFSGPCKGMLSSLQYLASEAAKHFPESSKQEMPSAPHGAYAEVYLKLTNAKLIDWRSGSKEITFCSFDACRYLAGLWLEELTYLQALACDFEEVAMNVEGVWAAKAEQKFATDYDSPLKGKNNEFDVLVRHKNQLLTIECKAQNWGANKQEKDVSTNQDTMHKLDNLGSKLGGLYARNLLISATELTDAMHARAKTNHIKVCQTSNLFKIKAALQDFHNEMD
ncbi:DUF1887 family protein [Pseudoalteromonas sp. SG43-7]|uniref:Card1-like endonuclease domain-containing protein n=1 Tax=Pseudoalteromonas sp. SG43-7 TaxID=2760966 RepID=UPI0015FF3FC0|nr:DUF1887 family CARF protein [Pseudoalteromonas sp. SG43-7]MBB1420781.1 DUF1887 family protein [Pseudoalteromonas sp. SG43-7]